MINFMIAHWDIILTILVFVAAIIFLAIQGKKDIIYKMLYTLVDEAEKLYGSKTGKLKFAYVLEKVYTMLPAVLKVFITYSTLEKWIEKALAEMKEYWSEQAEIFENINK